MPKINFETNSLPFPGYSCKGKCLNCVCVKANRPCESCLPGRRGLCSNYRPFGECFRPVSYRGRGDDTCWSTNNVTRSATVSQTTFSMSVPASGQQVTVCSGGLPIDRGSATSLTDLPPLDSSSADSSLPSLSTIVSARVSTLRHVPKGARDAWAGILGDALQDVCSHPSNLSAWCKLLMLPKCILANPSRGGHSHCCDTLNTVRSRISRWSKVNVWELWEELVAVDGRTKKHQRKPREITVEFQREIKVRRARQAIEDGQYKKAIQALMSDGVAQASAEVLNEMLAKHPQASATPIPTGPVPQPLQFGVNDVVRALRFFPNGTAPGPSSVRANHLKEAVFCPSQGHATYALQKLCNFINVLSAGRVPSAVAPLLCGATLFVCKKKGGGLRPIVVGEVLRCLTSKCISRAVQAQAIGILCPLQL